MNLRPPRRRDEPEVNLTPLIDVVFLLLIFFMVSTTFQRQAQLRVELPQASARPDKAPSHPIEITIDARGSFFVDGRQVVNDRPATLKQVLARLAQGKTDIPLIIRSDRHTPFQAVVTAMDVATQLGLTHMSLATTPVKAAPGP